MSTKNKGITQKQLLKAVRDAEIRAAYRALPKKDRSVRKIAAMFGVSKSTVAYAINGRE